MENIFSKKQCEYPVEDTWEGLEVTSDGMRWEDFQNWAERQGWLFTKTFTFFNESWGNNFREMWLMPNGKRYGADFNSDDLDNIYLIIW